MNKIFGISKLPVTTIDSVLNGSINKLSTPYPIDLGKFKSVDRFTPTYKKDSNFYAKIRNGFCNIVKGSKK